MKAHTLNPKTLRALHAEWRKLSPNLEIEPPQGLTPAEAERWVRLAYTNAKLGSGAGGQGSGKARPPIASWNELRESEARFILRKMRDESGSVREYRAMMIAKLAVDLWEAGWDIHLRERLKHRYQCYRPEDLLPHDSKAFIEELCSRIARRDGTDPEVVRKRFAAAAGKQRQRIDEGQAANEVTA